MKALGCHFLMEFYDCDEKILDDADELERAMRRACELSNATIVQCVFHRFSPYGVSGVVVIAESHFSIHSWPEYKYAACDFFTCGKDMVADDAVEHLCNTLNSKSSTLIKIDRGVRVCH